MALHDMHGHGACACARACARAHACACCMLRFMRRYTQADVPHGIQASASMAILTMATLTMAALTMAILTMAILTMAILTMQRIRDALLGIHDSMMETKAATSQF